MPYVFIALLPLLIVAGITAFVSWTPKANKAGPYVAEVWLEWEVCRGSTMYRQCFRWKLLAALNAKLHAMLLDGMLPSHYVDRDWSGRPCWYRYEYGIMFGVRKLTAGEAKDGMHAVWTTELPGRAGHAGEHAQSHPLVRELSATGLQDYKL